MEPEWHKCRIGQFPKNMVHAGIDTDGSPIFVGRAFFENNLLPAKVVPSRNSAYVGYGGHEHFVEEFEILMPGNFFWSAGANGSLPAGALVVGHTESGELLFMGRAQHQGSLTPGKVHVTHCCLYIPYNASEIEFEEYEALCAE